MKIDKLCSNQPNGSSSGMLRQKPCYRPIRAGRQTQCVVNENLDEAPQWSHGGSLLWTLGMVFRWTHFVAADASDKTENSQQILSLLISAGLATDQKFLTQIDRECFDRLDVWRKVWWLSPNRANRIISGINMSHLQHEEARRKPVDVIRSALYE